MGEGDSELVALRRAFEAADGDLAVLKALNSSLKRHNSDEANVLQTKVAWALSKARRRSTGEELPPIAAVIPGARDVLSRILARSRIAAPDGRPLFRYEVNDGEFEALEQALASLHREDRLGAPTRRDAAVFALYAAEWFRRNYEGHGLKWETIAPTILGDLPYSATVPLTQRGLAWWKRSPRRINGDEERLLSLALEGGFPTRVLDARSDGWLAVYLRGLIAGLSDLDGPDMDCAYDLATRTADSLRASFRNPEMFGLCAELALAIDGLKRHANLGLTAGVPVSAWLDVVRPTWRSELPIRIEGEGARHLVDGLIDARTDRLVSGGDAGCQRLLIRNGESWSAALQLSADGWVTGLGAGLDELSGRLRVRPAGVLADHVIGEIAMIEPPVESGPWRARPRQRLESIAGFPFGEAVLVELMDARGSRVVTWPKGEARRGEVLVFADPRPDEVPEPPDVLALVGSGSFKSRRTILYALVPATFNAIPEQGDATVVWRGSQKSLLRLTGPTRLGGAGNWWRVAPGEHSDLTESLAVAGGSPHGLEAADPEVNLVTQPLSVRQRRGSTQKEPTAGEVFWRRPGEKAEHDIKRVAIPYGRVDLIWRDTLAGVMRDRVRLAVLPPNSRVRSRASLNGSATFKPEGLEGWSLALAPGTNASDEITEAGLRIKFAGQPQQKIDFHLTPPSGMPIRLKMHYPFADGGFAQSDGSLFRPNQRIVLGDLRGARAFADGASRLTLELRSKGLTILRQISFNGELPLWTLSDEVARLASAESHVDDAVRLIIDPGGRRLDVGAYSVSISTADQKISIDPVVPLTGEGPFKLEWQSLYDLSEAGRRVLMESETPSAFAGLVIDRPNDLVGPGLVFLRSGDFVIGRPSVVGGLPVVEGELGSLQRAALSAHPSERASQIDASYSSIEANAPSATADLAFLHALVAGLNGIPPTAFDVLVNLPRHLASAAVALVAAPNSAVREQVWRLERDLCFLWPLVPVRSWARAFAQYEARLRPALEASGLQEEATTQLLALQRAAIADEIVALDSALLTPLSLAHVCAPAPSGRRSDRDMAMDLIRRSTETGESTNGACVFHDDPQVSPHLPSALSSFDYRYRQSLVAPHVAALRAAGRITLTRKQIIVLRTAAAEDPGYFAEAYAAALTNAMAA